MDRVEQIIENTWARLSRSDQQRGLLCSRKQVELEEQVSGSQVVWKHRKEQVVLHTVVLRRRIEDKGLTAIQEMVSF